MRNDFHISQQMLIPLPDVVTPLILKSIHTFNLPSSLAPDRQTQDMKVWDWRQPVKGRSPHSISFKLSSYSSTADIHLLSKNIILNFLFASKVYGVGWKQRTGEDWSKCWSQSPRRVPYCISIEESIGQINNKNVLCYH